MDYKEYKERRKLELTNMDLTQEGRENTSELEGCTSEARKIASALFERIYLNKGSQQQKNPAPSSSHLNSNQKLIDKENTNPEYSKRETNSNAANSSLSHEEDYKTASNNHLKNGGYPEPLFIKEVDNGLSPAFKEVKAFS